MNYTDKQLKRMVEMYGELPDEGKRSLLDQIRHDNILQAANEVSKTQTVYFGDLYAEAEERQKYFNKFEGYESGIQYFDDSLMGLRKGELIIIAAPSNYGKTLVALNLMVSTIEHTQKTVLIVSLEMTALEIATRVYNISDNHDAIMENLIIQTELTVNAKHIAAMIKRHQPDIVMLDHIQFLANQEKGTSEYERTNMAVASLKRLAIDEKIPIVAISHVTKARSGKSGEPTANDMKGSSSIEQDCDVGFMIYKSAEGVNGNELLIKCFKHRTKKPFTFHKTCVLKLDGIKLMEGYDSWSQ